MLNVKFGFWGNPDAKHSEKIPKRRISIGINQFDVTAFAIKFERAKRMNDNEKLMERNFSSISELLEISSEALSRGCQS